MRADFDNRESSLLGKLADGLLRDATNVGRFGECDKVFSFLLHYDEKGLTLVYQLSIFSVRGNSEGMSDNSRLSDDFFPALYYSETDFRVRVMRFCRESSKNASIYINWTSSCQQHRPKSGKQVKKDLCEAGKRPVESEYLVKRPKRNQPR